MVLIKKIKRYIEEKNLIRNGDKIIIGFSGGPDSVFLLDILLQLKDEMSLTLALAHINHLLRGKESDGDEEFVREVAKKNNIPYFVERRSMQEYARDNKIGDEEAGREIRYSFFERVIEEIGYDKVALGHNLDDEVETFMFRLMRGTSLKGLQGIPVKRDTYVRPILGIYKKDIMDYLNEKEIPYREDSSNLENNYTRNNIRLDLIPLIEERYNVNFKEKIVNLMEEITHVNEVVRVDYKDYLVNERLQLNKLEELSNYQKKSLLNDYLTTYNVEISRKKLETILKMLGSSGSKELFVGKTLVLKKEYDEVFVKNYYEKKDVKEKQQKLSVPGEIMIGKYKIKATYEHNGTANGNKEFIINEDNIKTFIIRTREAGDRIIISKSGNSKKVKDVLINSKIPKEVREEIPIVTLEGEIVWIAGVRGSEKYKTNSQKNRKIKLVLEEENFSGR